MKKELIIIPKIKVHPSKIILYNEIHYIGWKPSRRIKNEDATTLIQVEVDGKIELKRINTKFINSTRQSGGTLSKTAKKKLSSAIEYFMISEIFTMRQLPMTMKFYYITWEALSRVLKVY